MAALRSILWLSIKFNFKMKCIFYPGIRNILADAVSRMHEQFGVLRYQKYLADWYATIAFNSSICGNNLCDCHKH